MQLDANIKKLQRHFLPADFVVTDWPALEPFFAELANREINSREALQEWLSNLSELESVISEDACWRQIKMTCNTEDSSLEAAFNFFCLEIQPHIQPYADRLNRKLMESPFISELDQHLYFTYLRTVKKNISLFRESNVPLLAEMSVLQQQYGVIAGKMTVEINGQEYTLQQATTFLESNDRSLRESVYRKIQERRYQDREELDGQYTRLVGMRQQIAVNAGFENFRDYKFVELGRFDYSKDDCFQFHEAVRLHVLPLVNRIYERKKEKLKLDVLRPWDLEAEPAGIQPLRPFKNGKELYEKSVQCFEKLHPYFADCLRKMNELGHFDLESRKGKAPGGYNCPLAETGAPFIFMNAAGQMGDVTTMLHEGGHAIHSFLTHDLALQAFKEYPMEMAEVASMAMELISMSHWDVFFDDKHELKRAREHQLERVITLFPWIAMVDKFQHWVYEHPGHTSSERTAYWNQILKEFSSPAIDFSGLESYRSISWQRQLHLYEVPFYYIEYGIAQLGAIGIWKHYQQNAAAAVEQYIKGLSLGGMQTLPALYEAAGLRFDLSPAHIKTLMEFVAEEMNRL
jgi:oligoendopeptidase F